MTRSAGQPSVSFLEGGRRFEWPTFRLDGLATVGQDKARELRHAHRMPRQRCQRLCHGGS